jgi:hypothetical protein
MPSDALFIVNDSMLEFIRAKGNGLDKLPETVVRLLLSTADEYRRTREDGTDLQNVNSYLFEGDTRDDGIMKFFRDHRSDVKAITHDRLKAMEVLVERALGFPFDEIISILDFLAANEKSISEIDILPVSDTRIEEMLELIDSFNLLVGKFDRIKAEEQEIQNLETDKLEKLSQTLKGTEELKRL